MKPFSLSGLTFFSELAQGGRAPGDSAESKSSCLGSRFRESHCASGSAAVRMFMSAQAGEEVSISQSCEQKDHLSPGVQPGRSSTY